MFNLKITLAFPRIPWIGKQILLWGMFFFLAKKKTLIIFIHEKLYPYGPTHYFIEHFEKP